MVDINLRRLRLGEEKRRKKKKPQGKNIMVCPIPQGDHNNGTIKIVNNSASLQNRQDVCSYPADTAMRII